MMMMTSFFDSARPLSKLEVDGDKEEEEGVVYNKNTTWNNNNNNNDDNTRRLGAVATLLCLLKINAISLLVS